MINERRDWLSLLAKSDPGMLADLWDAAGFAPQHQTLRAPEIGGVMTRGRIGATGAPFNLGEISVTRCSVQLTSGEVGHGYVQGRDKIKAQRVAMLDALLQTDARKRVETEILAPLRMAAQQARSTRASKAAKTKVDFFTMVRGEN